MDELLSALLGLLLEILLELGVEALLDVLSRAGADAFKTEEPEHPVITWFACAFLGLLVGLTSVAVLPHPLFHRSKLHGMSLIVAPTTTGLLMSQFGAFQRRRGKSVVWIETFTYAFAFAFGMALVRFVHAS
jgi:uncharacterized membrane protein YadS